MPGRNPGIIINSTALQTVAPMAGGVQAALERALAHELVHAAQHNAGEGEHTYTAAAGLGISTEQQRATGSLLMSEAGAELVSTAISSELKDPARFRAQAAQNFTLALQSNWDNVNQAGYNPTGMALPMVVSPTAVAIVQAGLSAPPE